jgi:hypothetical protein
MTSFTEEDVVQWKNNAVTKAFAEALKLHIDGTVHALCNTNAENLLEFGRLQGKRFAAVDLLGEIQNPIYEDLIDLVDTDKPDEVLTDDK